MILYAKITVCIIVAFICGAFSGLYLGPCFCFERKYLLIICEIFAVKVIWDVLNSDFHWEIVVLRYLWEYIWILSVVNYKNRNHNNIEFQDTNLRFRKYSTHLITSILSKGTKSYYFKFYNNSYNAQSLVTYLQVTCTALSLQKHEKEKTGFTKCVLQPSWYKLL